VPHSNTYVNLNWLGFYNVYRVFLGVTPQGYYVVQDFYADNNAKLTVPYVVRNERDVEENSYDTRDMTIEGPYTRWHANGQKYMEGRWLAARKKACGEPGTTTGNPGLFRLMSVAGAMVGKMSGAKAG